MVAKKKQGTKPVKKIAPVVELVKDTITKEPIVEENSSKGLERIVTEDLNSNQLYFIQSNLKLVYIKILKVSFI